MENYLRVIHQQLRSQGLVPKETLKMNLEQSEPDASETVIISDDNTQFVLCDQPSSHKVNRNVEADLIELVRDYRCIWDTSCRSFKEHPKKQQAWRSISGKLNLDGMWYSKFLDICDYIANSKGGLGSVIQTDGFLLAPFWLLGTPKNIIDIYTCT